MSESPTSGRRAKAAERRREAFRLRKEGATFREIGEALGVSGTAARKAILAELETINADTREIAGELIALEAARLDEAHKAIWPKVEVGDLRAIDRMLKIMERRARLFGLDAPSKIAPTTPDGNEPYQGGGLAGLLEQRRMEAT